MHATMSSEPFAQNYNGTTVFCVPESRVFHPNSVEEVQRLVREHRHVKVVGARHSFTAICDSRPSDTNCLLSLEKMNRVIELDSRNRTVLVEGGIHYYELCEWLNDNGYALENLPTINLFTVVGGCLPRDTIRIHLYRRNVHRHPWLRQ